MIISPSSTSAPMAAEAVGKLNRSRVLVVGTYERAVVGYSVQKDQTGAVVANLAFTNAVHAGAVRCVAACNGVLSSGGADEAIQLCDLTKRVELGSLLQQNGSVTSLAFHSSGGRHFMFSTSEDGTICAWKFPRWECVHVLKGHRGTVNDFSVHPSGRLALSVGEDRTIRVWNLINGRLSYTTRLPKVGQSVVWSPGGTWFVVQQHDRLVLYDAVTVSVRHEISVDSDQLTAFAWVNDSSLLAGTEEGSLLFYQLDGEESKLVFKVKAHKKRVKAIALFSLDGCEGTPMATVGSEGKLLLWSVTERDAERLCSVDVPGRPTCLAWSDGKKEKVPKPSQEKDEAGDDVSTSGQFPVRGRKRKKQKEDKDSSDTVRGDEQAAESRPKKKKKKRQQDIDTGAAGAVDVNEEEAESRPKKKKRQQDTDTGAAGAVDVNEEEAESRPKKKKKKRQEDTDTEAAGAVEVNEEEAESHPKKKKKKKRGKEAEAAANDVGDDTQAAESRPAKEKKNKAKVAVEDEVEEKSGEVSRTKKRTKKAR